jgi:hypothetical protein
LHPRARTVRIVNQPVDNDTAAPRHQQRRNALVPVVLMLAVLWLYGGSDLFSTYPRPSWAKAEAVATKSRFEGGRVRESYVAVSFTDGAGVRYEAEYLALDRVARVGERVAIRYDRAHPTSIVLDDPNWWVVPTLKISILVVPILLLSVASWIFRRRVRRRNVHQRADDEV